MNDGTPTGRLRAWLAGEAPAIAAADVLEVLNDRDRLRARLDRLEAELLADLNRAEVAAALDDDLDDPNALVPKRDGRGPGVPAAMHLEAFGQAIYDAFGGIPYHVGSSATSKTWRDVDVRLILDDDRFHALFPGFRDANHIDAWWALLCAALSELGRIRTGLPIDFQIQSMTEANERYPGIRHPLFLIGAKDEHRPAMLATPGREAADA